MRNSVILILSIVKIKGEIENDPYSNKSLYERYENYGTDWMFFPDGNGSPAIAILNETLDPQPQMRFANDEFVEYWLYTRKNLHDAYIMELDNEDNFANSFYDINKPTKLIIHGWLSSGTSDTCQVLKDEFLNSEDLNVIILNWAQIAGDFYYPAPVRKTKDIGQGCGKVLDYLISKGTDPGKVHVIGHSLGAHISGLCASSCNAKISRITGLDPAAPGFERIVLMDFGLNKSQANFVDVIHTCAGILGYQSPIGTVDIYPNGGTPSQPGCSGLPEIIESCSHGRSWQYFAESINSNIKFKAVKCSSWDDFKNGKCYNGEIIYFGYPVNITATGTYYSKTGDLPPFAHGSTINN